MIIDSIQDNCLIRDKKEILAQADKAFDSMKEVLLNLNPPESTYLSHKEENFYYELNYFIQSEIDKIGNIRNHLKTHVEWDQLNVAFFGETNAGKSSTIESTLSYFSEPTTGHTIGDGTKDFTKDVTYHNFENKGKKIGLIDLPGIEGDEKGNLDDIDSILRKGVTKAHIVFYVYGNNKKPEPATVRKIKKYLDEQAIVFSVCNNRGKAGQYRRILKKEGEVSLKETEVNIQSKEILSEVLGTQYQGDIYINSLAAYLSVGNIEREDFMVDKAAFLEVFETEKRLREFSNLKSIINIIEEKSRVVEAVIFEANKQKLNHVLREVALSLDDFEKQKISEDQIESTREEIQHFLKDVELEIKNSKNKCKNDIFNHIDQNFRILENKISKLIDEGESDKKKVKGILNSTITILESAIKDSFKTNKKASIERVEGRLKQLERYSSLRLGSGVNSFGQINNFELVGLSELEISAGDLLEFGMAFSGFIFGPWGGLISLAGWGISKLFGDGGKAKAKAKVSEELRGEKNKLKTKYNNRIIKNQFDSFERSIFDRLKPMQNIPHEMLEWKIKINNSELKINQLIIK